MDTVMVKLAISVLLISSGLSLTYASSAVAAITALRFFLIKPRCFLDEVCNCAPEPDEEWLAVSLIS
jgi:hypothetical protein